MNTTIQNKIHHRIAPHILVFVSIVLMLMLFLSLDHVLAQGEKTSQSSTQETSTTSENEAISIPLDELNRGTPRSCVEGFLKATRQKNYVQAAQYLDLRHLPEGSRVKQGPKLAQHLQVVLDRAVWIDLELLSDTPQGQDDDTLLPNQERVGEFEIEGKTFNILLQRVSRDDGSFIWQFSASTVNLIPKMYSLVKYSPLGELLANIIPEDIQLFGVPVWQWITLVVIAFLSYLAASILIRLLEFLIRRKTPDLDAQASQFIAGPIRVLLAVLIFRGVVEFLEPSPITLALLRAETLLTIVIIWTGMRMLDLLLEFLIRQFQKREREAAIVLLRPINGLLKACLIILGVILWLSHIGFNITTLLAGFGIGGAALALAAQDTLKNFFGSVMIMLDKPFLVGQRIKAKGHDGVVEEIGVRSTKLHLLTGHQAVIPNEELARIDVENIGRRPYIKRSTKIRLAYDTPLEKVEKAVTIIRNILDNHEGMKPEMPPRVFFNEFNPDSLNILVLYWYHPPDYWAFNALNQRVNLQIMREFEQQGIRFALPSSITYLAHHNQKPLQIKREGEFPHLEESIAE